MNSSEHIAKKEITANNPGEITSIEIFLERIVDSNECWLRGRGFISLDADWSFLDFCAVLYFFIKKRVRLVQDSNL